MTDTICAIATPIGSGGVGIIRLSGDESFAIAGKVFSAASGKAVEKFEPQKMYYGQIKTPMFIDACLCVRFAAPHSFTGEDVVELHCHGGATLLNAVLDTLIKNGAKMAECGEFTKRAFINGKMDLSECEGLIDIINAESEAAISAASMLHRGELSKKIKQIQDKLKTQLAHIEVTIDYSEEDIEFATQAQADTLLESLEGELQKLVNSFDSGMIIKEGVSVAICGSPNAGKSSLLNAMLGYDRAIVTDIAGTTRDTVDGEYNYKGIRFKITDTAGIRESSDVVENYGIERAKEIIKSSDAVIFIDDPSDTEKESLKLRQIVEGKKVVFIKSKSDLYAERGEKGYLYVSAITKENIEKLKEKLYDMLASNVYQGGLMLTNRRHYDAACRALKLLKQTRAEIYKLYIDMLAYNIKSIYDTLGEITGESSVESIIDEIFSRFCLGK